ncbi:MAG: amino acid adenylation domain-containing protein [Deltaproteobacteria bacterium]
MVTPAEIAERIDALEPPRRAAFEAMLREETAPQEAGATLLPMEERLWFLERLESRGDGAYHIRRIVRLSGELDVERLQRAFRAVGARHAALRTRYVTDDGAPRRAVLADGAELTRRRAADLAEVLTRLDVSFDLETGPLISATLYELDVDYVLTITVHHIVADGWSMRVLLDDLSRLYRGVALPVVGRQVASHAAIERDAFERGAYAAGLAYWSEQLADLPPLDLPRDRRRPPTQDSAGARVPIVWGEALSRSVDALALRVDATPFMVLLALIQIAFAKLSGQDDFAIGTPIAGRDDPATSATVGCLINTLTLRTQVDLEASFEAHLERVRATVLGAFEHRGVPFERVLEAVRPARDLSRSPLFQTMFVLHPGPPGERLELPGVATEAVDFDPGYSPLDLSVHLHRVDDAYRGYVEYASALFERATVERWCAGLETLASQLFSRSSDAVHEASMLTDEQRRALVEASGVENPCAPGPIHDAVFAQAKRTPDACAVRWKDEVLDYRSLVERSRCHAAGLIERGVAAGDRIGVALERTPDLLAALLGVLSVGGVYVPLDPEFPIERLRFMVDDANVKRVVGTLDLGVPRVGPSNEKVTLPRVDPDADAYVMYTSGSTGRPKGVCITHRQAMNFLDAFRVTPGMSAGDVLLSITTISFDITILEFLLPLLVGATTELLPTELTKDGRAIVRRLERGGITVLQSTPSLFSMLVALGWKKTPGLRVLIGGEALTPDLASALMARADVVWNLYGPTEATVWNARHRCDADDLNGPDASLPIGRAIENLRYFVLDPHRHVVPDGVTGEIYIGGVGVARGYVGRAELTAHHFVDNPLPTGGPRLYRTGDLARRRSDGTLVFVGRIDHQVKVRGVRVELPEIEATASSAPGVTHAVALLREDRPGDQRLVLYVTGDVDIDALRAHLAAQLPDAMMPGVIQPLDRFPLTTTGKVDRKRLPAPTSSGTRERTAPRNATEERLVEIWEAALGVHPIGVHDDFFELGGHSMLAVEVAIRMEAELGRAVALVSFFRAPTIAAQAESAGIDEGRFDPLVEMAAGDHAPFFCIAGPGGNVLNFRDLARAIGKQRPFVGVQLVGVSGVHPVYETFEEVAALNCDAIVRRQPSGPIYLGGYSGSGVIAVETARQLRARGREVALLVVLDTWLGSRAARRGREKLRRHFDAARKVGFLRYGFEWVQRRVAWEIEQRTLHEAEEDTAGVVPVELRDRRMNNAFYRARDRYEVPDYDGRILLVAALGDEGGRRTKVLAQWRAYASDVEVADVPGDHMTFLDGTNAEMMARAIEAAIRRAPIAS